LVSGIFSIPLVDPLGGAGDFVAGEENALVRTLCEAVLERDDASQHLYQPLVIYGPSGAGKSFLAEGLMHAWRAKGAAGAAPRETLTLKASDFARQYADACDTDSISDFRSRLARPGALVIDAVHALGDKPRAIRELCYLIDQRLAAGRLVIVTSLVAPQQLADPGLASRLSAGLVVPLALPAMETRRHLLAYFARRRSFVLEHELLDRLAERLRGAVTANPSPRDLQGALLQLESTARLAGSPVSAELIESLLKPEEPAAVDFGRILGKVARRFGAGVDGLRSSSRRQTLVRARGVAILLARRLTSESLQSIGQRLGKRDHSTIHHALEAIKAQVAADESLERLVGELEAELAEEPRGSAQTSGPKRRKSATRATGRAPKRPARRPK
jgi:chromosomal replication initiator protein